MTASSAPASPFVARLDELYNGFSRQAKLFRIAMFAFDVFSIVFFVAISTMRHELWVIVIDVLIAAVIIADLVARYRIAPDVRGWFKSFETWTDIVVVLSLLASAFSENLLFLRALRLLRSYRLLAELRSSFSAIRRYDDQIKAVLNLLIFMFVMSSIIFVMQEKLNDKINSYIDALYFTITTLSTTGYGDIVLVGNSGKLLSILIMLVGISLFLRMLQTIFRPNKIKHSCPDCGLKRHEFDAVHCKACGRVLAIEDEGAV